MAPPRGLRGELDTLVGKAMHDEPERRYASAQALADDVENYLAGRPLLGAPDSFAYRARKFVARHRFGVAASIIIAALAVAFVWSLNNERRRAIAAEARAEREAKSTRRSRDFLVSLFEAASPENGLGRPTTAREVIDKGSEHLEQELKDEPETAARLSLTIAQVYSAFGDPKASTAAGERALALAVGDAPETALLRAEILLTLASQYDNTERFDDARRSAEEALALRQRHAPDDHSAIAEAMTEAAATGVRRGDLAVARTFFDRAIAEQAKAARIEPLQRAQLLRGVSELDNAQGKLADSLKHAQESVAALTNLPPTSPVRIDFWRALATAQVANADPGGAVATLQHALDVGHAALGENSYTVADIENDIAVALNGQGRYREAIPHLERSIEITEAMRPGVHVATAFSVVNLGSLYENLGNYAKSEQLMREGIVSIEAEAPDSPELDSFRCNLARTLMKRGKFAEARALFDRALHNIAAREGAQSFGDAFQTFRLSRLEYAAAASNLRKQICATASAYSIRCFRPGTRCACSSMSCMRNWPRRTVIWLRHRRRWRRPKPRRPQCTATIRSTWRSSACASPESCSHAATSLPRGASSTAHCPDRFDTSAAGSRGRRGACVSRRTGAARSSGCALNYRSTVNLCRRARVWFKD